MTTVGTMTTMATDVVRWYVRGAREARGMSQDAVAKATGLALRSYTDWELGRTDEIKTGPLMRALDVLRAPAEHIKRLVLADEDGEEAQALVRGLIAELERLPAEAREARTQRAVALIDELLTDPQRLDRWIGYGERLREESQDHP